MESDDENGFHNHFVDFLRRMYYIRYPALGIIVIMALGPLAKCSSASSLFANTLLVHTVPQAFALTIIALTAAKLCLIQMGVILFNAPARFAELLPGPAAIQPPIGEKLSVDWNWRWWKTVFWIVSGLMLPVTAVLHSIETRADSNVLGKFPNTVSLAEGSGGIVAGIFADMLLLILVAFVERWLVSASSRIPGLLPVRVSFKGASDRQPLGLSKFIAGMISEAGYTDRSENGEFSVRPGHLQQLVVFAFCLIVYFGLWTMTEGSTSLPKQPLLPTLFFAVLGLGVISSILSGVSFFLDYYRFPVLIVLVFGVFLSFRFSGREHYFASPACAEVVKVPMIEDVLTSKTAGLTRDRSGLRTLVVVTAPGGGIHAAAWTAQVLTGLHQRYGDAYAKSLFLISAVSGGSVGTMYYAANFERLQDVPRNDRKKNCELIVERAGGSGLEAVGWGLVFQDLPSIISLKNIKGDRGTLLDACWQARLRVSDQASSDPVMLSQWREPTLTGKMPIVVFNATEVESGRRVLFSPVQTKYRESLKERPNNEARPVEFSRYFDDYDLAVTTAARLSATFPYVTPTATPQTINNLGHMADGGYADNEGIETVVDWVSKLIEPYTLPQAAEAPFDRILVLRIRHQVPEDPLMRKGSKQSNTDIQVQPKTEGPTDVKPDAEAVEEKQQKKKASEGFSFAAFGPLKAVLTVRGTSQVERGQLEIDLLKDLSSRVRSSNGKFAIESLFLDFTFSKEETPPPLSWKLSPSEFVKYKEAWKKLAESEPIKTIDNNYFSVESP